MATLQSLRLSVSGNEWAPSRHGNETTREKRDLAGTRARKPLEDRGCTFKGVGLNAADKKVSALSPMENIFLDIPFYRTFWRGTSLSMIWVFPERRGRRNRRGGEVAKRPLEKIESSMTIIFELRVGATVAVDRRSPLSSRWAAQYGLLPFQAGPEPIGSARNPKA